MRDLHARCFAVAAVLAGLTAAVATCLSAEADTGSGFKSPQEVVERVKAVYADECCFTADFNQVTVNVAMDIRDKFKGIIYVRKPRFIALEVSEPERQRVVLRGNQYAVVFPDDKHAARGVIPPEMNVESFFGFFADIEYMDKNFAISFPERVTSRDKNLVFLRLEDPDSLRSTYRIIVGIDVDSFIVKRAIIYDALGNYNRFDLSDVTFVDDIPAERFKIDVPSAAPVPDLIKPTRPSDPKRK